MHICVTQPQWVNSFIPGASWWQHWRQWIKENFPARKCFNIDQYLYRILFNGVLLTISVKQACIYIYIYILDQVMVWCYQTSDYLNQCWPSFMTSQDHNEFSHHVLESTHSCQIWVRYRIAKMDRFSGLLLISRLTYHCQFNQSGLILGLHPANERHRYKVMASLIGWVQA